LGKNDTPPFSKACLRTPHSTRRRIQGLDRTQHVKMVESSLSRLPDEVLHIILRFTPPWSALALERTSERFGNVVNEPLLWRFYCQTSFAFWDSRHEISSKFKCPASSVDWKRLYLSRRRIDVSTTETLNSILASQVGRIDKVHSIVEFGYDAKDTLLRHAHSGPDRDDYLARRLVSIIRGFWYGKVRS
jgi:F-box protein 21